MKISKYFEIFSETLHKLYDPNESVSITKWIFEDYFATDFFSIKQKFEDTLDASSIWILSDKLGRLMGGEPIQYIIGKVDFLDIKLKVNPSVLIPRPETEWICFELIKLLKKDDFNGSILDICTGSGVIAIALKKSFPNSQTTGLDLSDYALQTAIENSSLNHLEVQFKKLDILKERLNQHYDLIISNPPYVLESEKEEMHINVLNFEPPMALFVEEENPIIFYLKIIDLTKESLNLGGYLVFELNPLTAVQVQLEMEKAGFSEIELLQDLRGKDRMLIGKKK